MFCWCEQGISILLVTVTAFYPDSIITLSKILCKPTYAISLVELLASNCCISSKSSFPLAAASMSFLIPLPRYILRAGVNPSPDLTRFFNYNKQIELALTMNYG